MAVYVITMKGGLHDEWSFSPPRDKSVPLVLDFIDGDERNQRLYNLRLLCPNCYFLEKQEKKVSQIVNEYEKQNHPIGVIP